MTMANTFYKILILGAPASGKGTISSRILKNFQLAYISSGDKLRWHIKNNTGMYCFPFIMKLIFQLRL